MFEQSFLLEDHPEVEVLHLSLPILLNYVLGLHGGDDGFAILLDPLHYHPDSAYFALLGNQLDLIIVGEGLGDCLH